MAISTEETKGCEHQPFLKNESILQDFFSCKTLYEINRFIDPEMGLTILYANGCYPQYERLDSLSSEKKSYNLPDWLIDDLYYCLNFQNTHISTFHPTNTPVFDGEVILQYGAFIDESEDKNMMSKSIQSLIQTTSMENDNESYLNKLKKDLSYYKDLESRSIRVILSNNASEKGKCGIRIYHFTEKQDRLYLTLLDLYSIDTSV